MIKVLIPLFLFHVFIFSFLAEDKDSYDFKMPKISSNGDVSIFDNKFQGKVNSVKFENNKIICNGIFWYMNIQISGDNFVFILDKDKNVIEEIVVEEVSNKKPLLIVFNSIDLPNHFTANKIKIFFDNNGNIKNISMEGNVNCFYFILDNGKVDWVNKSVLDKLIPFFDRSKKKWDVKIEVSKGEAVTSSYAIENWEKVVLPEFKVYNNSILGNKEYFEKLKNKLKSLIRNL